MAGEDGDRDGGKKLQIQKHDPAPVGFSLPRTPIVLVFDGLIGTERPLCGVEEDSSWCF